MFTVDQFKVVFRHDRPEAHSHPTQTVCFVTSIVDGSAVATGVAKLNPRDQFVYEAGRKLALARAIKGFPRDERQAFWDAYFAHSKRSAPGPVRTERQESRA